MKIQISNLDRQFSLFIRARSGWKCERCFKQFLPNSKGLHCSHFHGRRKKSVRFDPDNCFSLCFYDHQYFTENPLEHTEWVKKKLGEKIFLALTLKANTSIKPDYEMIRLWLKQTLERMKNENFIQR